jgi:biopolymer transport protein ExbB/TolQ
LPPLPAQAALASIPTAVHRIAPPPDTLLHAPPAGPAQVRAGVCVLSGVIAGFTGAGSGFFWALLAVLAWGLVVAVERAVVLGRARVDAAAVAQALAAGDGAAATAAAGVAGPLVAAGLGAPSADAAWDAMAAEAALLDARLRARLGHLAAVGNISTMVGLLGTVAGLMAAFAGLGDATATERAARLSEGIATAMGTTAFGLLIGIPAVGLHAVLDGRLARLQAEVEAVAARVAARAR